MSLFIVDMFVDKHKMMVSAILIGAFLMYSGYLYSHLPAGDATVSVTENRGKLIWQQYNCIACHQVYGLGGYLGPDLTNEYSLRGPAFIRAFVQTGTKQMPHFKLTESEITALTDFLKNIDASGKADPRSFTIQVNGNISQL